MDTVPAYGENLVPAEADRRVWSPLGLALIAVLLNFWPASIFHALNYERLGIPQLKRPRLIQYSVLGGIMCMLVIVAGLLKRPGPVGLLPLLANVVFGYRFYTSQHALYKKHVAAGGPRASLVVPLVVALVFVAVLASLAVVVEMLVGRLP